MPIRKTSVDGEAVTRVLPNPLSRRQRVCVTLRTAPPLPASYLRTIETVQRTTQMEVNMLRKLVLVIVALTSTAAIATPASARGFGGGHFGGGRGFHGGGHHFGGHRFGGFRHHHHHYRFARYGYYGGGYGGGYAVDDSCYRVVDTEVGPRRVNTCE
jgi:hypothetical protein